VTIIKEIIPRLATTGTIIIIARIFLLIFGDIGVLYYFYEN
jgi:hypothetical protein